MTWGIDLAEGGATLAIAILLNHDQPVHYISGQAIHHASEGYRGEGKTDAKDAAVTVCMLRLLRAGVARGRPHLRSAWPGVVGQAVSAQLPASSEDVGEDRSACSCALPPCRSAHLAGRRQRVARPRPPVPATFIALV